MGSIIPTRLAQRSPFYHLLVPPRLVSNQPKKQKKIHVDKAIVTILCQNSVQGLEVLTKEGKWIKLNIPKGALVVIVGDGLQAWTNGRVEAVKHRVAISGDKARLSCGFSSIPKDGVSVEIPPQLVDEEHTVRYRSFVYSDYLAKYLTSTRLDALESFAGI